MPLELRTDIQLLNTKNNAARLLRKALCKEGIPGSLSVLLEDISRSIGRMLHQRIKGPLKIVLRHRMQYRVAVIEFLAHSDVLLPVCKCNGTDHAAFPLVFSYRYKNVTICARVHATLGWN